jgi:hypothetical protein
MNRSMMAMVVILVTSAVVQAGPRFPTTQIDVGEVKSGPTLVRRFEMINDGAEVIKLLEVRVGCGCVKPKLEPAAELPLTLGVGEKRTIVVEVNTLSQADGDQSWHASVVWEEGQQIHEQKLTLLGQVTSEVSVQPATLFLFTDSALRHDVTLIDRRDKPLTITALSLATKHLKAHLRPTPVSHQPYRSFRIEVEVNADCPEGRYDDVLSIATNDPGYAEVRVPITLVRRAQQQVKTAPESVWLEAVADQAVPAKLLKVYDGRDRPVKVERVTAEDPAVTATWATGHDGTATVKVKVDRDRMNGSQMVTALRIELSEPERTTLTLPVTCFLK